MNTITIDSGIYNAAETYASKHNISLRQIVERYLSKLTYLSPSEENKYKLPKLLEVMGGCLSDVNDSDDEKLNYILSKHK